MTIVPHPAAVRDEVARLSEMIGLARQLVAVGTPFDLTPVGEAIAVLCDAVTALPHEQGKSLRADLEALSERLGRLGEDLQAHLAANDQKSVSPPFPTSSA